MKRDQLAFDRYTVTTHEQRLAMQHENLVRLGIVDPAGGIDYGDIEPADMQLEDAGISWEELESGVSEAGCFRDPLEILEMLEDNE